MPYRDPERARAYYRAYHHAYYVAHPEAKRAYNAAWNAKHPKLTLVGERERIDRLPEELRPIALLIREARREIRKRRTT